MPSIVVNLNGALGFRWTSLGMNKSATTKIAPAVNTMLRVVLERSPRASHLVLESMISKFLESLRANESYGPAAAATSQAAELVAERRTEIIRPNLQR
jgi:hypothetical protein